MSDIAELGVMHFNSSDKLKQLYRLDNLKFEEIKSDGSNDIDISFGQIYIGSIHNDRFNPNISLTHYCESNDTLCDAVNKVRKIYS